MNKQKSSVTPKRKTPSKRRSLSGQENNDFQVAKISSGRKVEQFVNDMRVSACRSITNIKSSLHGMSNKFRRTSLRSQSFCKSKAYEGLDEQVTPVKLYSPFTFVTPSPKQKSPKVRTRTSPRFKFVSPSGKFQKDVQDLSKGMRELQKIEKSLSIRKLR